MAEDTRVVLNPAPARPLPPEPDLVDVIVPNQAELARLGGGARLPALQARCG